jgi:hypothetical protein
MDEEQRRSSYRRLASRAAEIEEKFRRGFGESGDGFAGSFRVVAQMLAEQEERIEALEEMLRNRGV